MAGSIADFNLGWIQHSSGRKLKHQRFLSSDVEFEPFKRVLLWIVPYMYGLLTNHLIIASSFFCILEDVCLFPSAHVALKTCLTPQTLTAHFGPAVEPSWNADGGDFIVAGSCCPHKPLSVMCFLAILKIRSLAVHGWWSIEICPSLQHPTATNDWRVQVYTYIDQ